MKVHETIEDLLVDWKMKTGAADEFTKDGIIDPARWNKANKKILFILKEPGEDPTRYCKTDSLLDLYRQWNGAKFSFNYLGRVAYGLQSATKESYPTYEEASLKPNKDEAFLSTAFMNLKKTPTLRSDRSTDAKSLETYVRRYPEWIIEQVRITQSDIVVCCGDVTHSFLKLAISLMAKPIDFGKTIFFGTCHPTARQWKNHKGKTERKKSEGYRQLLEEYQARLADLHD